MAYRIFVDGAYVETVVGNIKDRASFVKSWAEERLISVETIEIYPLWPI